MIESPEAVLPKLGEPDTCAHSDDGLRDRFDEYPLDAWLCPRYLRGLADEALSELRASCTAKFGRRDTSAPEATYVRVDGTLAIEKARRASSMATTSTLPRRTSRGVPPGRAISSWKWTGSASG
ncbi:hypothetical protein ACFU7X_13680 [Streptomyces chartreusis]|uniref:hypothetical protein n=1 Tax=Streptomyces chartreusis TaxID=1969 RepID=UPI0036B596E5